MILQAHKSTHAPLRSTYLEDSLGVDVNEYGAAVDRDGVEYRALGGLDHKYSTDFELGSGSYPPTIFYMARNGDDYLGFDELEHILKEVGLWDEDALTRVLIARGNREYAPTFQVRPPERAPSLDVIRGIIEDYQEDDGLYLWKTKGVIEAAIPIKAEQ